jgi:hypothetical protein
MFVGGESWALREGYLQRPLQIKFLVHDALLVQKECFSSLQEAEGVEGPPSGGNEWPMRQRPVGPRGWRLGAGGIMSVVRRRSLR